MIGIIGAGISGLAVGHFLEKAGVPYQLLEASSEVGGYMRSKRIGQYLFEFGPNSILSDAETLQFIRNYIPDNEIIYANEVSKSRYVFKKEKYRKLPSSPVDLMFNGFFSWRTKFRILTEMYRKSTGNSHETLADFFLRRFNQEVVDYALNPFISGIYAGDPQQLLLNKTFPQLHDFEQKYGSLLKGMSKNKSTERRQSVTFTDGIQMLPRKMSAKLKSIQLDRKVLEINKEDQIFHVKTKDQSYEFEQLVITTPAFDFATLYQHIDADFVEKLQPLNYAQMCVVHTVLKKTQTTFKFDGFGGLNPKVEQLFSAGSIWSSSVFQGRCPDDEVLITSFVGGMQYLDFVQLTDREIKERLTEELQKIYHIEGRPVMQRLFRWKQAIPQYDQHLIPIYQKIKEAERHRLWICANWFEGVSIADRIRAAQKTVEKITNQ